jgi:hypothetical protein
VDLHRRRPAAAPHQAERRAAQLYDQEIKAKRGPDEKGQGSQRKTPEKTLAEHGVTKQQMSQWRKLTEISEDQFEAEVAKQRMPTADSVFCRISLRFFAVVLYAHRAASFSGATVPPSSRLSRFSLWSAPACICADRRGARGIGFTSCLWALRLLSMSRS